MAEKKESIQVQLKELEDIAQWFEKEEDFDIEEGLKKVKEGASLVKKLKTRIQEVENEFRELEAEIATEE
jgi:exonuclease VII small subunit